MSQTIKRISISYDALNPSNTFTSGDLLHGRVTVEVAKGTKIDSLLIKFKGKAFVRWTERHGKTTVTYWDKEKYFTSEQYFIREHKGNDCDVVAPGTHVYPFTFQIPQQTLPASFNGTWGYVGYFLETKLSRSMRISSKDKVEIRYIPKPDMTDPALMTPQYGTKDKKMKLFTSGSVSFTIHTERMGYSLGEGIKVVADVQNSSSRALRPKYCLYSKHSFFARGRRRLNTHEILKEEGEPIAPSTHQTITKILTIPPSLTMSILICRILKVEYKLKVYLDVPYASDPEIKFPVVILPLAPSKGELGPPAPSFGFGDYWNPGQAGWNSAPYSAPPAAPFMPPPYTAPPAAPFSAPPYTAPPAAPYTAPSAAPPPAYESYALYPPLPNYSEKP
ncbi:arrestin domain-containing protein 3-like isoform X2 [Alosa sapidissima]|uniref:arrestin domain-containing protein 3-like isoform X2 n=1 Tax=Alosa sapidissima TaxID=34773 RepID=UPI001C083C0B|nr:arrestin domain-containing protein 3-like isoform X2 [Alosa sapidissima]